MGKRKLEPWEQKLIGRKTRYTDSWIGWIVGGLWKVGDSYFDSAMEGLYNYLADKANPKLKDYELYGKKIDRPWGYFKNFGRKRLGSILRSESVRQSLTSSIKRSMMNPNELQYASGLLVATTCFLPADGEKRHRPPIHFEDKDLVAFYNELGIVPDESAIIEDLFHETSKVKDANFTDEQWRTYIMPIILSESYKKQLNIVYDMLQQEYLNTPAMTKEMLDERIDKAQYLLGKMYQGFSLSLANHTEYLAAPLNLLDTDPIHELPDELDRPLSKEEQEKYQSHMTMSLITKEEVKEFKNRALKVKRPEKIDDQIHAFYRSLSGNIGRESIRSEAFEPGSLSENRTEKNLGSFINAITALKNMYRLVTESKDQKNLDVFETMKESMRLAFDISELELNYMLNPETSLEQIKKENSISEEVLFGYEKINLQKQLSELSDKDRFLTQFSKTVSGTIKGITNVAYEGGKLVYSAGEQIFYSVYDFAKNGVDIGEVKLDLTNEEIEDDLFGDSDRKMADFKAEEQKKAMIEAQKKEAERRERERIERENAERIKEAERQRQEQEQEAKKAEQRNEALKDLEPWQKKLIGHQIRYSNTWMGSFLQGISKNFSDSINSGVDKLISFVAKNMSPDVKRYRVYGKKLDRPWGYGTGALSYILSGVVQMDSISDKLKLLIQRQLLAPGVEQRVSGEAVAMACFAPSFIQGEMRPPCHFDLALMAKFYNETGILPDEASIVADMMDETMKITEKTYTDEQWRKELMPQIIKGSYRKQFQIVCKMLHDEYMGNPAMSKKMLRDRMEKAAGVLGEMYQDFSRSIANTTEYLEAPLKFLHTDEKLKFPKEIDSVLSEEQKEITEKYKMRSITSKSDIRSIIDQETEVERSETVGALLEQFYKATCGIVGTMDYDASYVPKKFDADHRDIRNERCMMAAIVTAKKLASIINSKEKNRNFFCKLFKRKKPVEEQIALDSMKQSMTAYGFNIEQIENFLDPKKSIDDVKQQLGITDDLICGIEKIQIPPSESLEEKQKTYMEHVHDMSSKIPSLVKEYAIGATEVAYEGTKWVITKTANWAYNKFMGGSTEPEPKIEKVAEFDGQKNPQEVEPETVENATGELFFEAQEEDQGQLQQEELSKENLKTEELEDVKEIAEEKVTENTEEDEEFEDAEEITGEKVTENTVEDEEFEDAQEIAEEKVTENTEEDEEFEDTEEMPEKKVTENTEKDEEFEEVEEFTEEKVSEEIEKQVEFEDLEKTDQPEGIEEELLKDLETDPETQNQGWMSWGMSKAAGVFSYVMGDSHQTTVEEAQAVVAEKREQVIHTLEKMDISEKEQVYEKLAQLVCLSKVNHAIAVGRINPQQAIKGLENNRLDKYTKKFTENPGFRILCEKMIRSKMSKKNANTASISEDTRRPPEKFENVQNNLQMDTMPTLSERRTQSNQEKQTD